METKIKGLFDVLRYEDDLTIDSYIAIAEGAEEISRLREELAKIARWCREENHMSYTTMYIPVHIDEVLK